MQIQGQVGPVASAVALSDGISPPIRQGKLGETIVQHLHGRYFEQAYRRNVFAAANPTGVTGTAFVSGTTTVFLGTCLSNPVGSTVNLALLKVGYQCVVAPASAAAVVLGVGYNSSTNVTHTTALSVRNAFVGVGAAGTGLVDSSFTCPTAPNTVAVLGQITTVLANNAIMWTDLEGSIILPPGGYAIIASLVAAGASGHFGSFMWEEVPV